MKRVRKRRSLKKLKDLNYMILKYRLFSITFFKAFSDVIENEMQIFLYYL